MATRRMSRCLRNPGSATARRPESGHKGGPRKSKRDDRPKVISSNEPAMRPEDSPFAILQQLKLAK